MCLQKNRFLRYQVLRISTPSLIWIWLYETLKKYIPRDSGLEEYAAYVHRSTSTLVCTSMGHGGRLGELSGVCWKSCPRLPRTTSTRDGRSDHGVGKNYCTNPASTHVVWREVWIRSY
jgi:hypothetical protein